MTEQDNKPPAKPKKKPPPGKPPGIKVKRSKANRPKT